MLLGEFANVIFVMIFFIERQIPFCLIYLSLKEFFKILSPSGSLYRAKCIPIGFLSKYYPPLFAFLLGRDVEYVKGKKATIK